jgi:hypothetical protein
MVVAETWSSVAADWAVAKGTLVLAIVAVFQQWLQRLIIRPRLRLQAWVQHPDAEKTRWAISKGALRPNPAQGIHGAVVGSLIRYPNK